MVKQISIRELLLFDFTSIHIKEDQLLQSFLHPLLLRHKSLTYCGISLLALFAFCILLIINHRKWNTLFRLQHLVKHNMFSFLFSHTLPPHLKCSTTLPTTSSKNVQTNTPSLTIPTHPYFHDLNKTALPE